MKRIIFTDTHTVANHYLLLIPAREDHFGIHSMELMLNRRCPKGHGWFYIYEGFSFDGSKRMAVNAWRCAGGCEVTYSEVRAGLIKKYGSLERYAEIVESMKAGARS